MMEENKKRNPVFVKHFSLVEFLNDTTIYTALTLN